MRYVITNEDKEIVYYTSNYKYRIYIVDFNLNHLDEIEGISSIGTYSIDSESTTRRTVSMTIELDSQYRTDDPIEKRLYSWIGYSFLLQIGLENHITGDYKWYDCGYYMITESNTSYNATTNSLTTNLADWFSTLDGTRNGQVGGAPVIEIPNIVDGKEVAIKTAIINLITSETKFKNYIVSDVGEYYGMQQNNLGYLQYREDNPLWDKLPYTLEYEAGCLVSDMLIEMRDLYPNYEMYFDVYGNFCTNLIPSNIYDVVILDNDFLQSILVSDDTESVTYDINSIKNVTEVFGAIYEVDRYATETSFSDNTYSLTLANYEAYSSNELIALVATDMNGETTSFRINELDVLPLYKEFTTDYISEETIKTGETYIVRIKKVNGTYVAYFLGQYQPHALCVLTADEEDPTYNKSYFAKKYNCNERDITFRVESESPFTIQKLGEILDVKIGDEFDNILSSSVATENAIYQNKISSSMNDVVTITTKMMPFVDVNIKASYKKQQDDEVKEYIVKSVEHNLDSLTTTLTMYRLYPLYTSDRLLSADDYILQDSNGLYLT